MHTFYVRCMFSFLLGIFPGVKLLGHMVAPMFNNLSNCQNVFQSSCTILYSHQQCMRVPGSPHPDNTCYYLSRGSEVVLHCGFDLYLLNG